MVTGVTAAVLLAQCAGRIQGLTIASGGGKPCARSLARSER